MNLDWNLFLDINHLAGQSAGLDLVGRFFAVDAFWLFGVLLIALWFWPGAVEARRAREQRVVNAAAVLAFALLSAHFIGVFFYRARPFVAHAVTQLIPYPPDAVVLDRVGRADRPGAGLGRRALSDGRAGRRFARRGVGRAGDDASAGAGRVADDRVAGAVEVGLAHRLTMLEGLVSKGTSFLLRGVQAENFVICAPRCF